ncbi:hypothetical protein FRB98_005022, partial [Tulasnella sp. 332]
MVAPSSSSSLSPEGAVLDPIAASPTMTSPHETTANKNKATKTRETSSTVKTGRPKFDPPHSCDKDQTRSVTAWGTAVSATTTLSGAAHVPICTPSSSSGNHSGISLSSVAVVVGVVTAIVLAIIGV